MKYKIISMDFDGTVLTSEKVITDRTKKVLNEYRNKECLIAGITARNLSSVKNVCDVNIFDYLILNNGSCIYDVKNKDEITVSKIEDDTVKKITNYFNNKVEKIEYCSINRYYELKNDKKIEKDFWVSINDISEIKEDIDKINIYYKDNNEEKFIEYLQNNFKDIKFVKMVNSKDDKFGNWFTLNAKGTDKLETLKKLCMKLDVSLNDVIFFGDGANDLSVIGNVGLGVAMENAIDTVKELAKAHTLSNNNDGVAEFLEKMIN